MATPIIRRQDDNAVFLHEMHRLARVRTDQCTLKPISFPQGQCVGTPFRPDVRLLAPGKYQPRSPSNRVVPGCPHINVTRVTPTGIGPKPVLGRMIPLNNLNASYRLDTVITNIGQFGTAGLTPVTK